jgi:osmoprotectant transport system permease protein
VTDQPLIRWDWIYDHLGAIGDRVGQHLYLAAIAIAVGFIISFALAAISIRRRRLYPIVTLLATAAYTIPSFALFAGLVAITGLTTVTAEVPLILYTVVLYVPNIVAGFDSVPLDVLDAADGMGYTRGERWWRVELPLAVPLVVAGLRLASVSTIGLVTVSAILGDSFGGLGYYILDGYERHFTTEILVGGLLSIALAVVADLGFVIMGRLLTPWAARHETRPGAGRATPQTARQRVAG